jgi:hypothetical protein
MRGTDMNGYLVFGIAVGVGAALVWKLTHGKRRPPARQQPVQTGEGHWSPTARILTGAIGGGLVLYSSRVPGKMSRIAMTAGTGLLMRSLNDQPVTKLTDFVRPQALIGA